jgi:ATP-binding cassette subfamily F protein uup
VLGYLQDFLFTPERARAPITRLSGGERNRLLLARLFAQPSNLLVMDEPTNDLDVETLELLEELLAEYPGTLLMVSHDRDFLDHVVTSTLVMEGDGRVGEFVGGYTDWVRQRGPQVAAVQSTRSAPARPSQGGQTKRRMSFKEQKELEQLPARIEQLEAKIAQLTETMHDPAFYQRDSAAIVAHNAQLAEVQAQLDIAYGRWMELDAG